MEMYGQTCAQNIPAATPRSPFEAVNDAAKAAKDLLDLACSLRERMIGSWPEDKESGLAAVSSGVLGTMESQANGISAAVYAAMSHLRSIEAKLP